MGVRENAYIAPCSNIVVTLTACRLGEVGLGGGPRAGGPWGWASGRWALGVGLGQGGLGGGPRAGGPWGWASGKVGLGGGPRALFNNIADSRKTYFRVLPSGGARRVRGGVGVGV